MIEFIHFQFGLFVLQNSSNDWRKRILPKGQNLGEFEHLVMIALIRLDENAYGVTVRREIETRTNRAVTLSAVYATLDRLERKGFVSSREGNPTPERGGRKKRFFRIEAPGIRILNDSHAAIRRMWSGIRPTEV